MNIVAEQKIFDEANLWIPVEIKEEEFEDEIKTEVVKPVSEELEYNYELQDIDCDPLKFENKEVNDPNGEEPLDCRDEIELEYNDGILLLENKEELVVEFEDQAVSGVQQDIQIVNGNHEINRKTELRLVKEVELGNENGKTQIHQEETFFPDEIQLYIKEDLNEADLIIEDWQGSNSNLGQKHSKPSKDDSQISPSVICVQHVPNLPSTSKPVLHPFDPELPFTYSSKHLPPSAEQQTQQKKRSYKRKNCCMFCDFKVSSLRRHLLRKHTQEMPVAKYIALLESRPKESKKERQQIFEEIKRKGNFLYNQSVMKDPNRQSADLLPERMSSKPDKKCEDFIFCSYCKRLLSRHAFYKHIVTCDEKLKAEESILDITEEEDFELIPSSNGRKCTNAAKQHGIMINPLANDVSTTMKDTIFPILNKTDLGRFAMMDPLIVSVASDFLSNHLGRKHTYTVSRKMRDAAKLLMQMKKEDNSIKQLSDCFEPKKTERVLNVVKQLCGCGDDGDVDVVGMPARLSWVILEGCSRLIDDIISSPVLSNEEKREKKQLVTDFQTVIRLRWKYVVSTNAETSRKRKKLTKPQNVADEEDIRVFTQFLNKNEALTYSALKNDVNVINYEQLCKLTIAHIMILSKLRSAEAAEADLECYLQRNKEEHIPLSIKKNLNEKELTAFKDLDLYLVPGKNEKHVPVLLTKQMKLDIELIIACRGDLGVPEKNKYLFARPGLDTPFTGTQVLAEMKKKCTNLKKPEFLTGTGLRHFMATTAQVEGELFTEHVCQLMGHTKDVHKKNYRFPLNIIQKEEVGSHMLQYEDAERVVGEVEENDINVVALEDENMDSSQIGEDDVECEVDVEESLDEYVPPRKRTRWTDDERIIVLSEFTENIKSKVNPGIPKCRDREQSMFEEPNGSFESAKEKEKAAEETSNLDSSSCESAKEPKRKRKNRVFRLPGEETKLDDDDHSVPSPVFISTPKLKASPSYPDPTKYFKQLLKSNNTDQLLVFPMLTNYTSTHLLPIPSESEPSPSQLLITNRLSPVSIDLVTCTNTPIPPCHNSQTITPQLPGTSQRTGDRRLSMNQRLMWEVIEDHGRRLTGIEQKLDQIIDVLTRGNENPCPIEEQPTFQVYKMLPIKEEEDFNEFEKQISTSPRVRQKLIKVLGCVSGKTVRTLACKVMRKLMSDGFAETFSLTGKQITGGIKKKTFDGTHTYQIVVDVCFRRFKDCKNRTVREAVSEWLVQAKFRRKGREERLAKLMQTEDGDTH